MQFDRMRYLRIAVVALLFASCSPTPPPRASVVRPVNSPTQSIDLPPVPTPSLELTKIPPKITVREISGITFTGVSFDRRNSRLVVLDQNDGPNSRYSDAAEAGKSIGGIAAVNGGFFTPEGDPLGLVVSSGKISGSWNTTSSLGSGVWYENHRGAGTITRREKLGRVAATTMLQLIQAGPMLVEDQRAIHGLEATKISARTVILWDGGTRWWLGLSSPCSLANLAQSLATGQPAGWPVERALNLDGGRSSDLWISSSIAGGPIIQRPAWNRPVRNFMVLVNK